MDSSVGCSGFSVGGSSGGFFLLDVFLSASVLGLGAKLKDSLSNLRSITPWSPSNRFFTSWEIKGESNLKKINK